MHQRVLRRLKSGAQCAAQAPVMGMCLSRQAITLPIPLWMTLPVPFLITSGLT